MNSDSPENINQLQIPEIQTDSSQSPLVLKNNPSQKEFSSKESPSENSSTVLMPEMPELETSTSVSSLEKDLNNTTQNPSTKLVTSLAEQKNILEQNKLGVENKKRLEEAYEAGYDPSVPLVAQGKVKLPEPEKTLTVGVGDIHAHEIVDMMQLRIGNRTREWMDDTHDKHAYRCLPLVIANQLGWDFLCPVDFIAIWDGGPQPSSIKIGFKKDENNQIINHKGIQSHFGAGIITFNLGGIFKTPKGANLICKGTPNYIKDGIQALEGVIETDWSPFTFTMNWKFTRANHPVEFLTGEPICRIMPYPRGYIQSFNPVTSDIKSNPEFQNEYTQWSKSREKFNYKLHDKQSDETKQKWQKHYMRGLTFVGLKQFDDHESKIQLKDFTQKETVSEEKLNDYFFPAPDEGK